MVSYREECCADDTGASIAGAAAFVNVRREEDILIIILAGGALDAGKVLDLKVKALPGCRAAVSLRAIAGDVPSEVAEGRIANRGHRPLNGEVRNAAAGQRTRNDARAGDQTEGKDLVSPSIEQVIGRNVHRDINSRTANRRYSHRAEIS